ncbi:MAG: hypothetical protein JNK49_04310 [Planctomycetes bacterium]|nr:hypothetical protein [Planctomycetota bacterium]
MTLTYPTGTTPPPSVVVNLKVNNQNILSVPFPPNTVTSNSNGTTTLRWDTTGADGGNDLSFGVDCKASNDAQQVAGDLVFTPPGGGAPTSSGGATMTCSGCGA